MSTAEVQAIKDMHNDVMVRLAVIEHDLKALLPRCENCQVRLRALELRQEGMSSKVGTVGGVLGIIAAGIVATRSNTT